MPDSLIDIKNKQISINVINTFQNKIFNLDEIINEISFSNQENIRYQQLNNDDQANAYLQDLNLIDLNNIRDPQVKACHLYEFFDYLNKSHQLEGYARNLIKLFQLAVYYDDNYVYRYYLAFFYRQLNLYKEAIFHIKKASEKIKNKKVMLYKELNQEINQALIEKEILNLTKDVLASLSQAST